MDVERRRNERKRGFFAVQLDSESRLNRIGVTRDVSVGGMLIASPSRFAVGEEVTLRVYFPDESTETVHAKVARVEEMPFRSDEPWRYRLAVVFTDEHPGLMDLTSAHVPALLH